MKHSFYASLAVLVGIIPAIILTQIEFWVKKNCENKKNFREGRYWTYNSIEDIAKYFPYLSARQINYAIKRLKDEDLILIDNFNKNNLDRTAWYTISDKCYSILQNCKMDLTNLLNGNDKIVKSVNKELQTNNPDIKEKNKQKRKAESSIYGGER